MAIHHFGRAAKVQVNTMRAECGQTGRVLSHAMRVRAQQLRAHRHSSQRASGVVQLGHDAQKNTVGQQLVGDADELGHATVNPAHAGEDVAQYKIEQALHGGEQDFSLLRLARACARPLPCLGGECRNRMGHNFTPSDCAIASRLLP